MTYTTNSTQTNTKLWLAVKQRRQASGFTVVEMLTAVAIFGILATVAVPSFSSLIASQRASAMATDIYVALVESRSEAVKRNVNVTLAQSSGGWHAGWMIQAPDPNNGSNTLTLESHSVATGTGISGPDNVVYQSSGRVQGTSAPCFGITATQGSSSAQKWVTIDLSGRPLVKTSSCS